MKNLLSINDLALEEITQILDLSFSGTSTGLKNRLVATLFYEPSTRTRLSFELAAKRSGADVINFDADISSEKKGESLIDTALTLQALGTDVLVVRHPGLGTPHWISQQIDCSVVNAGDGSGEHPTQALLDLYTVWKKFGRIAGLHVGIVGDVRHSRVAHSLYLALAKTGAKTTLVGPRELVSSRPGPHVSYDLDSVLPKLDVCYVLRLQTERHKTEYSPKYEYCLTRERAEMLPDHAVVMHPGPMNRGAEIDSDVADSPRSLVQEQVANGVRVRAALLHWLTEGGE